MVETWNIGAWADHVTIVVLIGATVHGMCVGGYRSTALGLRCLGSVFGGFALQDFVRGELESLDVPDDVSGAAGLVLCAAMIFVGATWVLRRIESWQDFRDPRLPGTIDALLGGGSGLATGMIAAGFLQVVWMIPALPDAMRIDLQSLDKRCGHQILSTYATFVGEDAKTIRERVGVPQP